MTRRKSILGALVLCALAVCAFGAASASATGLTAYTCTEGVGKPQYKDSHCLEGDETGAFTTKEITQETETTVTGEAVPTEGGVPTAQLKGKVALTEIEVTCNAVMTESGTLKNVNAATMRVDGKNITIHYTECHASLAANTEKKCTVKNKGAPENVGTITTNALKSTTEFNATEHFVKFEPEAAGGAFAEFFIENGFGTCPAALIGQKVVVSGSARGRVPAARHSHLQFDATSGSVLNANGGAATYTATHRVTMHEVGPPTVSKTIGLKTS